MAYLVVRQLHRRTSTTRNTPRIAIPSPTLSFPNKICLALTWSWVLTTATQSDINCPRVSGTR